MTIIQRLLIKQLPKVFMAGFMGWMVMIGGAIAGLWRPNASWVFLFIIAVLVVLALSIWRKWMRERFVRESAIPQFLKRKLRETYPFLSGKDCDLVERGLRQFFIACARSTNSLLPCRPKQSMRCGTSLFCTPKLMRHGAIWRWVIFCTILLLLRWANKPKTTTVCAALGTGLAKTRLSTLKRQVVCHYCLL